MECSLTDCDRPVLNKQMCSMHYQRFRRYGDPLVVKRLNDARYEDFVVEGKPDECWLWQGKFYAVGYGRLGKLYAHRLAYERAYGAIPAGLSVCHSCDEPACVNPAHLRADTHSANMADKTERGRHHTLLTEALVRQLREEYEPDPKYGSYARLARKHGLNVQTVRDVITRRSWAHIP